LNEETNRIVDKMYTLCKVESPNILIGLDRCTIELIVDFAVSNIKYEMVKVNEDKACDTCKHKNLIPNCPDKCDGIWHCDVPPISYDDTE
ncbi:MAG: hypothetical protein Q8K85_21220, partial [Hyphomicrobium sp.]|nr:hypothetical protein [Hyphomicrobium sp.]